MPDGSILRGRLDFTDRITSIEPASGVGNDYILPGFIDLQVAFYVARVWPHIALLVTSGEPPAEQLPPGSIYLKKPYEPLHAVEHARALTG